MLLYTINELLDPQWLLMWQKLHWTGDEKGGNSCNSVDGLELEVRGRYAAEWCLLHPIWCWSISKLCKGFKFRSQVIFYGRYHNFRFRCTSLPQRPSVLVAVVNLRSIEVATKRKNGHFIFSVWFLFSFHFYNYIALPNYPHCHQNCIGLPSPIFLFHIFWQVYIIYTLS